MTTQIFTTADEDGTYYTMILGASGQGKDEFVEQNKQAVFAAIKAE
jgi:hypothetical protein